MLDNNLQLIVDSVELEEDGCDDCFLSAVPVWSQRLPCRHRSMAISEVYRCSTGSSGEEVVWRQESIAGQWVSYPVRCIKTFEANRPAI